MPMLQLLFLLPRLHFQLLLADCAGLLTHEVLQKRLAGGL
jgi:hypothetical protein